MDSKKLTAAIYTLGCKVNFYESEAITESLSSMGVLIKDFDDICDIYIINTCTVTADSDRKGLKIIRRAIKRNPNAFIAVTGCLAQRNHEAISKIPGVSLITGNEDKISVAKQIMERFNLSRHQTEIRILPFSDTLQSSFIDAFNRTRAYIKIEDGCSSKCAYCIIPKARGPVRSKPREDILREVTALVAGGCKEIVLTGIEISSYQFDFITLLEELDKIDGLERIRLGSLDPFFISKELVDSLSKINKLCPHFHISLQSGSSNTLAAMRRKYNAKTALERILYLKNSFNNCNLFADVIVGFPGESDSDFAETVHFIESVRFLHLHIFPYSQRAGTEAAEMTNQISPQVKKERAAFLADVQSRIKMDLIKEYISSGEKANVLFETYKDGILKGHSDNFIEFVCESKENLRGTTGTVIPVSTDGESITGYLMSSSLS